MRLFATSLFLFLITGQAIAAELEPFKATYAARFNGISITATRELSGQDGNWRLDFDSSALFASIKEYSRFTSQDGHITPQHYEYRRKGLGRNRATVLNFEPSKGMIFNVHNPERDLKDAPPNILDKVSYQIQLALDVAAGKTDLQYKVADGKKIRDYKFSQVGTETLKTPLGPVETIKVARVRDKDSGRETTVWIAPQWNYALVKLIQREENGKRYQINLTNLSINGEKVAASQ
ncbi:DUF3108 domain-containing protein [Microbulbifer sp. EKSA008]|uniref:DUF3108 domain-containing protein n=1 Tax=unclassified Microbulbifer TaxID=2619833 RepID=UPI0024AC9307|nr:DUF3108 domain-containing protein [Microbulbifer sp. VAAF005]WHI46003.1 DUF3108 domain-containing protein [Microbulbifer sp. VAAF005]WNZ57528.1 DUF3108 domain-containing protein [Microbulbifer sp. MKSA007]